MGGDAWGPVPPWKITICHLFPRRKLIRTSLRKQFEPPPPKSPVLSVSDGEIIFFLFLFLHVAVSRANNLVGSDRTARTRRLICAFLLFACNKVKVPATWYIRNGVNKANHDKMWESSQRSFLFKCQIMWNLVLNKL